MTDFDLNAFLADQRAEGVSQGEGEFTISHAKAAQKMSQYSLPREHAWVLKLVQSAVAWKCSGIKLTQTRNHSTFTFYTQEPRRLPRNEDVVGSILRADPESDHPTSGFGTALRILVEKAHLSFLLRIDRDEGETQAIYAGVHFSEMGEKNRAKQRLHWEGHLNLRIHHIPHTEPNRLLLNYIPVRDHALPILWELEEYAYLSSVPIVVDGRRIDGVLREESPRGSAQRRPIRLCGFNIPGAAFPRFEVCSDFADQVLSLHARIDGTVQEGPQSAASQAFLMLSIDSRNLKASHITSQGCFLNWVRNGVVVDREKLKLSTNCLYLEIFVSAEGLSSDLTGFQLRRNLDLTQRRHKVLRATLKLVKLERESGRDIFAKEIEEQESGSEHRPTVGESPPHPEPSFPTPPQMTRDSVEQFAKHLVALARDILKDRSNAYVWDEDFVERSYRKDLETLIQTELGESPPINAEPLKYPEPLPRQEKVQAEPKRYQLPTGEKFRWIAPDERDGGK